MAAGTAAALVSQTIVVPSDMVAQRQMVARDTNSTSPRAFKILSKIIHEGGIRSLYRGYGASLLVYVPTSVIWWTSYGKYQDAVFNALPETSLRGEHGSWYDTDSRRAIAQSISGGLAGATTGAMTSPLDVIKVRRQLGRTEMSTLRVAREALRTEGTRAFFKGCVARMLNMTPSGLVTISAYEFIKRISTD